MCFSELPEDVLRHLVPYLLVGRRVCGVMPKSYYWVQAAQHASCHRKLPRSVELVPAFENAWAPTLRTKLVCKELCRAVNEHMDGLLQPREVCIQAAAKIQVAAKVRYAHVACVHLVVHCMAALESAGGVTSLTAAPVAPVVTSEPVPSS